MRHLKQTFGILITFPLFFSACERLGNVKSEGTGELCISFSADAGLMTKSHPDLPDTNDFILTIRKSDGGLIYNGTFGDCPERLEVLPGTYIIRTESGIFSKPAFDSPQFGDEQCVIVPTGGRVNAKLVCTQINAGIRLTISKEFLTECPTGILFLKSTDGKLMYSYSEKRTAYFNPGTVFLILNKDGVDNVLMTQELKSREIHSIKVSVSTSGAEFRNAISMTVDTSRVWFQEECVIGGSTKPEASEVLTVADARRSTGKEDVWVCGYIVGGDLTSASASFNLPFESMTNILLGPKSTTSERSSCLSVQLPSGEIREALNLPEHPELFRRRIKIKGDIVGGYFGIPGIKNTRKYELL